MMRLAIAILVFAATPALAGQPDRQPLINMTRGSPATPGGVALLTMAANSLSNASAAISRGDAVTAERELLTIQGDTDSGGFVRAVAAIAANAALAARAGSLSQGDAARIDDCVGGLIDAAEAASDPSGLAATVKRLQSGADTDNDRAIGWSASECGLVQLKQMIDQMAGAAGL